MSHKWRKPGTRAEASFVPMLKVPEFPRLEEYIGPWAIEPNAAATLWNAAASFDMAAHMAEDPPKPKSEINRAPGKGGKVVAVIPVMGTLMKSVPSLSGGTSTIQLRRDIRNAAADPDVSAILLAIDSPGGTVAGTEDLVREIRQARKKKPVWAQIEDLGASAAYWVAATAEKTFANSATALIGSIGTMMSVYDVSGMAQAQGVKALVYATGPLKGAGFPGAAVTEEQDAYFQGIVDKTQPSFDAGVKRGRGLTDKQLADVRTGGVFLANDALAKKLIDGIQPMETTLDQLASAGLKQIREQSARGGLPLAHSSKEKMMDFHTWLSSNGFDAETLSEQQSESLEGVWARETGHPLGAAITVAVNADISKARADTAAEAERLDGIRRACADAGHPQMAVRDTNGQARQVSIEAQAMREGWTMDRLNLEILRAGRPQAPDVNGGGGKHGVPDALVLEAAICQATRLPNIEKAFPAATLEQADRHYRNISLQQVLLMASAANGYTPGIGQRINTNLREVLGYAFPGPRAGFSSVSLPGILSNVATKDLLAGYMEEDQSWREISSVKSVNDFKQMTSYRMLDDFQYEEVGAGGEIKGGTVDQESYTRQAKTYAKMFKITRQDIINDDLGAFDDLRSRLGRGAAQKFNNVFWTAMLAGHSTFFTSARTNYITGATTTLLTDGVGLALAIKAFRQMKTGTADGAKRIGGRPEILLVPPELEFAADNLFQGEKLNAGSGPGDTNIYRNKYRPVVSPWLSDSNFTGYSTTAWYLFRSPGIAPMMNASFLNGVQAPTVESADADFDILGIQFRGYHDFGCDQAEYLCGIKSKGAA